MTLADIYVDKLAAKLTSKQLLNFFDRKCILNQIHRLPNLKAKNIPFKDWQYFQVIYTVALQDNSYVVVRIPLKSEYEFPIVAYAFNNALDIRMYKPSKVEVSNANLYYTINR